MSKWPVLRAIPVELFNSLGALEFVKKEILLQFGSPKFILSDNDLKFDFKAIKDFARGQKIQRSQIPTYNPRGNGMVERMAGTIKRASQKICRGNMADWDLRLDQVLYGYLLRSGTDRKSPFKFLYGVKSLFSDENEASVLPSTKEAREFELAIALAARAERVVSRMVTEEQKFKTGDWVLLGRENQPKGSKFEARMWLEPYNVRTVQPRVMNRKIHLEDVPENPYVCDTFDCTYRGWMMTQKSLTNPCRVTWPVAPSHCTKKGLFVQ